MGERVGCVCMCVRILYAIAHAFMSVFGGRHDQPFAVAATFSDSQLIFTFSRHYP